MKKRNIFIVLFVITLSATVCVSLRRLMPSARDLVTPVGDHAASRFKVTLLGKADAYYDAAFIDSDNLMAVGYDGHDPKHAFFSKDGGHSWEYKNLPVDKCVVESVDLLDPEHGWVVGCSGLVLFTHDSGASWEKLGSPTDRNLDQVKFVSAQEGYATSRAEHACQIYKTVDGGKSWQKVFESSEGDGAAFDLATLGNNVVLVPINDGYLLRSEDGGKTWLKVEAKLDGASSATFTEDGTAWVVGRRGSFFTSDDQGRTWHRPANLPASFLSCKWSSIAFADAKRGVAVGEKGLMAVTYDGGRTWTEINTNIDEPLSKVLLRDGKGLVLGFHNLYEISF